MCSACLNDSDRQHPDNPSLSWSLSDKLGDYGVIVAQHAPQQPLNDEHRQLINTLVEQLTSVLAIERQVDHQQQLMLMEERAAIARELHDSIAQSLSCLKMQIACLQMQGETLSSASQALVQQMREELNGAYRQLRELLTTFRLQLTEPGLLAALQSTVAEFNPKLGLTIHLDYQLGPRTVPAYQAIHLLQIAREGAQQYPEARRRQPGEHSGHQQTGRSDPERMRQRTRPAGRDVPPRSLRLDHHARSRQSLHGRCDILPRSGGGTEVRVSFTPDNHAID